VPSLFSPEPERNRCASRTLLVGGTPSAGFVSVLPLDSSRCCAVAFPRPRVLCLSPARCPQSGSHLRTPLHTRLGASHPFQRRPEASLLSWLERPTLCTQCPFFPVLCLRFAAGRRGFCRKLTRCLVSGRCWVLTAMLTGQAVFFKCYFFAFACSPWTLFPPAAPLAFISFESSKQILSLHLLHLWE